MRTADGGIVLKLVNCAETPKRVEVLGLSGKVRRALFTGSHRDAHNSPFEPEALKESVSDFLLPGTDILPPLSLVIYH